MIKRLKRLAISLLVVGLCTFATYSAFKSKMGNLLAPTKNLDNISRKLAKDTYDATKKSRQSAVKIISSEFNSPFVSYMSGTYFKTFNGHYVITAQHGIRGPCEFTIIMYENDLYNCVEYVKIDQESDYIIIQTEEISSRTPINIPGDLPSAPALRESFSIMSPTVYTGYPNAMGPLTVEGTIAGYQDIGSGLYMISYAWAGASGAGVFDKNGNYIGHIVAIDLAQDSFGEINILENVVLIIPSYKVDWSITY